MGMICRIYHCLVLFYQTIEGAPNLPGNGRYIAIPQGSEAILTINSVRTELIQNVDLAPSPRIPFETEDGPLEYKKNLEIYSNNAFYPENPIVLSEKTTIRGVDVVMVGITPFQYNPVTKELLVYKDIDLDIEFEGGNGQFGDNRYRSRWWDPLLNDMLLNASVLPKIDYNEFYQTKETGCEYLIIVPTDPMFMEYAEMIKEFRCKQGIHTDIMTIDETGGNNANTLDNFIENTCTGWDIVPAAVLLIGDYGTNGATQ